MVWKIIVLEEACSETWRVSTVTLTLWQRQIWCCCKHTGCDICRCEHNLLWCSDTASLRVIAKLLSANTSVTFSPAWLYSSCIDSARLRPSGLGQWTVTAAMYWTVRVQQQGWKKVTSAGMTALVNLLWLLRAHTHTVSGFLHTCIRQHLRSIHNQNDRSPCDHVLFDWIFLVVRSSQVTATCSTTLWSITGSEGKNKVRLSVSQSEEI